MKSQSLHVRKKVVALLVSMTALWTFAAVVTLREGLNLLFVSTLDTSVGRPTESLVDALQQERKLSAVALSGGAGTGRQALTAGRERTDAALAAWRSHIASGSLDMAASDQLKDRLGEAIAQLDKLGQYRNAVDSSSMHHATAVAAFTTMIDAGFRIYGSMASFADQEIAKQARTLITMSRARELLSQEDALLSGVLVAGTFTAQDITEFTKLVGAQRFLYANTSLDLPPDDLALYQQAISGQAVTTLRGLEDMVLQKARAGAAPPLSNVAWQEAIDPAVKAMRAVELAATDHTVERATPAAIWVIARLLLAGGLGLLAVIAAIVISITTARRLIQQLERLREAARDLAENRLPQVVNRLSMGQIVDVATESPPLSFGNDEVGQVGQAFNAVQDTAIRAAVQQAELRHGVRDVFLSLARRTQNLVHKQLGMLDAMERQADAEQIEDLFRIDHLATRMRRNAENLIVLSGAAPGRTWRRPVAMIDVVRGALGEVEDYSRVTVLPVDAGALAGRAVGDVIHLLAELIENAVSYSPPYTGVNVTGQVVSNGFVVEIEDRGVGMNEADLQAANAQLADPPDFSLADANRLGHYVVAKLAQRHGIRVHLRPSPYGGTAAIVLIPVGLIVEADEVVGAAMLTANLQASSLAASAAASPPRHAALSLPAARDYGRVGELPQPDMAGTFVDVEAVEAANGSIVTPSGLPWRVRQASIAPQLRDDTGSLSEPDADFEEQAVRDPEVIRQKMQSYQYWTERGRDDAADDDVSRSDGGEAGRNLPEHVSGELPGDRQEG